MFELDEVVPWGRSFEEYRQMFALDDADLQARILGCADGPASFNAEGTRRGVKVVSCDPLYGHETSQIRRRIDETYETILAQTRENLDEFVWETFGTADELGVVRMRVMQDFLEDYEAGTAQGRYVEAGLPVLPFADHSFDLALCSHFLFLYSEQLTSTFHCVAITELCRIATEVRLFPLLALGGGESWHVTPVSERLAASGLVVSIEKVPYEFRRGSNQMMRVRAPAS